MSNSTVTIQNVSLAHAAVVLANATRDGKIFSCEWYKKGGEKRKGTFLNSANVSVGKNGKGMSYNPSTKGLVTVYETSSKSYKMISVDGLISVQSGGVKYVVV